MPRYVVDRELLSDVVRHDLPLLGDIAGLRAVSLQCHIGTDTISLARLGARVTGLDFSEASIREARALAAETGDEAVSVQSDVYAVATVLPEGGFDLVYTGIGALCWLPRIADWADVVARLLAPGGSLFLREAHPILWAMDETLPTTCICASRSSSGSSRWSGRMARFTCRPPRRSSSARRTSGTTARRDRYRAHPQRPAHRSPRRARERLLGGLAGADDAAPGRD